MNQDHQIKALDQLFQHFKLDAKVVNVINGNAVKRYEIKIDPFTVKLSQIEKLSESIAFLLHMKEEPIILPVYEKGTIAIDINKEEKELTYLNDLLKDSQQQAEKCALPLALGYDLHHKPFVIDLADQPHLLIAGSTGSGKSVGLRGMITGLLHFKQNVQFVFIDPKQIEFSIFGRLPQHRLLIKHVITDPEDALQKLEALITLVKNNYTYLSYRGVSNVSELKGDDKIPYTVIIIDELADLLLHDKRVEKVLLKIVQKARAAGVHVIAATQRPSVDIVSGAIKNNFPGRISYKVGSVHDSRTILDNSGAEKLSGQGDSLYKISDSKFQRVQSAYVNNNDIEKILPLKEKAVIVK